MATIKITAEELALADSLVSKSNPGYLRLTSSITDAQIVRMIELGLLKGDIEDGRDFIEPTDYAYDIANRRFDLEVTE